MADAGPELLTVAEMARADALAEERGTPSLTLMENAGRAVADAAQEMLPGKGRVIVLCGPGNNGGDGFVAARLLDERGYTVRVALIEDNRAKGGDAGTMASRWTGETPVFAPAVLEDCDLVVDALFGAGLRRPLSGRAAEIVAAVKAVGKPVLCVDVPSGLDGTTGGVQGAAVQATRTVAFFRRKPGHLLLPGRLLCGTVTVADIGIPGSVLDEIKPQTFANGPELWLADFPWPKLGGHKYDRGHAVVVSGPWESTGAARLAARGALRAGAGLVTVASPTAAAQVNAAHLTAIMLAPFEPPSGLGPILDDKRKNAVLIGPGLGFASATAWLITTAFQSGAALVLDADALMSFNGRVRSLAMRVTETPRRPVVLTPHEGEFKRLFPDLTGSKIERARAAAKDMGAFVVLKGTDTVVAAPDGRAAINENAPPWLATAGAGDVLAGFVTGLLAQRMAPFEAACAAVWLHGEAAGLFGPGLIAEDLPEFLPDVLRGLNARQAGHA